MLSVESAGFEVRGLGFGFEGYGFTWKRGFKLPWREAGTPKTSVDPDQQVVNRELSLSLGFTGANMRASPCLI